MQRQTHRSCDNAAYVGRDTAGLHATRWRWPGLREDRVSRLTWLHFPPQHAASSPCRERGEQRIEGLRQHPSDMRPT